MADGRSDEVPVRHFGAILEMTQWRTLAARLKEKKVRFIIEPDVRFGGEPGEQATFFILDPSGNALPLLQNLRPDAMEQAYADKDNPNAIRL